MEITRKELLNKWLNFFKSRGHIQIKNSSLIPDNDPSVLFTTAGMHPLVPYLLGQPHPQGKRLCDVQRCIRTGDIDEVGDDFHLTFFEMLGNWSLGDYFKETMIPYSYEFLTKELGIESDSLAVTVFKGNDLVGKDDVSANIWEQQGIKKENIYYIDDNWWGLGSGVGPCGPDSEMFIDTGKPKCCPECNPSCHCGKFVEIWNDVFMEYNIKQDKSVNKLSQQNVDTGMGLERTVALLSGKKSVYDTEIFADAIKKCEELSGKQYNDETKVPIRIIVDHLRAATFIIGDESGIAPSNVGQGYVLRRIIRRAIRNMKNLGIEEGHLGDLARIYIDYFKEDYPDLVANAEKVVDELNKEETKFLKTLEQGTKEFEKVVNGLERKNNFMKMTNADYIEDKTINGKSAFRLFDTFGFPIEMTEEMAKERGYVVDKVGFDEAFKQHQELARTTNAGIFKGGLADDSVWTTRLHTACHLLLAGLRKKFGTQIEQKGSNITSERLRFDFNFDRKLTDEEVKDIEDFVNDTIKKCVPIERLEMTFEKAKEQGGYGVHKADENELVSVYKIGDADFQICGGPHANNTGELVNFKIVKQEAVSSGVRRIKAVINFK